MNPSSNTEYYTPGHTSNATAFMAARDLESHGFFLTPLLQRGFHVLDVGCGPGTITNGIAGAVFPGQVSAIDVAPAQLEYARRLSQGQEIVNVHFLNASAYAMPFARESFDLVFAHGLLEYLSDPVKALTEFHRVTRPGGFAAVCSPDWDNFELSPLPASVQQAISAYRRLQETNGGNTSAGAYLGQWLSDAGYLPLSADVWVEEYDTAKSIGEYLAVQLEAGNEAIHAKSLREWAADSKATFRQVWKYATGLKVE